MLPYLVVCGPGAQQPPRRRLPHVHGARRAASGEVSAAGARGQSGGALDGEGPLQRVVLRVGGGGEEGAAYARVYVFGGGRGGCGAVGASEELVTRA